MLFTLIAFQLIQSAPSLELENNVWIAHLSGSRVEAAAQYGSLLRNKLSQTALPYFTQYVDRAINQSPLARNCPLCGYAAKKIVHAKYFAAARKALTKEDRETIRAFAEAASGNVTELEDVVAFPDVGEALIAYDLASNDRLTHESLGLFNGLGCTTLYRSSDKNGGGETLIARNLDYPSDGRFEANQALVYFHPTNPKEIEYLSIGTLGMPTGAITGMNREGIILTLHQLFVNHINLKGRPILTVTEDVLRKAHNLKEALTIISQNKFASSWRINLISTAEKKALSVDVSANEIFIHETLEESGVVTNTAISEAMQKSEYSESYGFYDDTRQRFINAMKRLENTSTLTIQDALNIISADDMWSESHQTFVKSFARNTVGSRLNVQTLLFAPERNLLYIAIPDKFLDRPIEGKYFPLQLEWDNRSRFADAPVLQTQPSFSNAEVEANNAYRKASLLTNEEGKFAESLLYLDRAMQLQPDNFLYPLMAGATSLLRAWEISRPLSEPEFNSNYRKQIERSIAYFDRSLELEGPVYYQRLATLLKIKGLYAVNKTKEADLLIESFPDNAEDPPILKDAIAKTRRYRAHSVHLYDIVIDYLDSDIVNY